MKGSISQIIGPVVDVVFSSGTKDVQLPSIRHALEVRRPDGKKIILEVQQHIGDNTVRTVAMDSTDGLSRGLEVDTTGSPITMPIGAQVKGRLLNVIGQTIDGLRPLSADTGTAPIHKAPPKFQDLTTSSEVL